MRAAFVLGFLLVGLVVPAEVAQAQLPTAGIMLLRDSVVDLDTLVVKQYDPPAVYAEWWQEVQACTGMKSRRDVHAFGWIRIPGHGFLVKKSGPYIGYAAVESKNFLILEKYLQNKRLVQHEMAHALSWETTGKVGHTQEWWNRCELVS